jgi:hypothetical protein
MFITDESLSRRHSVRSAMLGTVYISLLAERGEYQAVDVINISLLRSEGQISCHIRPAVEIRSRTS